MCERESTVIREIIKDCNCFDYMPSCVCCSSSLHSLMSLGHCVLISPPVRQIKISEHLL